ncbi:hypothetical protein C8F04DRAFT_1190051 [Mycena alexandri]|uniref:DUF6699 domain-containing protein n=1 Tax=Mycena alexandri TaxID=1745969 RepID=A0AAD6SK07_9AGAR|nr:hypothetical protein C8F04DRAFT_1190051 [Mycena alexandri]
MSLVRVAYPTPCGSYRAAAAPVQILIAWALHRFLATPLQWNIASPLSHAWQYDWLCLAEYATTAKLSQITIVLDTMFTVKRRDRKPLLVGDVLHAIHQHLAVTLTCEERRAVGWRRIELLKGRYFSGLTYLGGNQFGLNLQ